MVTPSKVPSDQWLAAVCAAAQRLASRLRYREATVPDVAGASPLLPGWWRDGLATAAIFGDGLVALPASSGEVFSRPVAFMNAAEISQTAGGEVVPLAWVDGGAMVALVHDVDERPVMLTAPDPRRRDPGASQIVASSLVAFLDSLIPQTLCRFVGPGGASATAELVGEASLLIERNGELSRRDFADEEELSDYVATFVADGVDAGMTAVACPAGLRRVIDAHSPARAALLPEARAEAAIHQLLASGDLELAGPPSEDELGEVLDSLIDDASRFLERNRRTMNPARAFAEWLSVHRLVEDVYADDDTVRAALSMAEPDTDIDPDGSAS